MRVLMVADNPEVSSPAALHTIEEETSGIVVARAGSEREALDLVARTRPDVVCVDASRGADVTRSIKRLEAQPSVVLIMSEADRSDETMRRVNADGAVRRERWQSELGELLGAMARS